MVTAQSYETFSAAVLRKLILEIARRDEEVVSRSGAASPKPWQQGRNQYTLPGSSSLAENVP
jgi:hypothetical protein